MSIPLNFNLSHPNVPDKIIFIFLGQPGDLTARSLILVLFCFDPPDIRAAAKPSATREAKTSKARLFERLWNVF